MRCLSAPSSRQKAPPRGPQDSRGGPPVLVQEHADGAAIGSCGELAEVQARRDPGRQLRRLSRGQPRRRLCSGVPACQERRNDAQPGNHRAPCDRPAQGYARAEGGRGSGEASEARTSLDEAERHDHGDRHDRHLATVEPQEQPAALERLEAVTLALSHRQRRRSWR